jgi:hypothetical protein
LAAGIAAGASVLNLVLRAHSERRAELRETNRKALEPFAVELGGALHSIVACSYLIVHRRDDSRQQPKWRARAEKARETLRAVRPKVRYQLWGLDEGIQILTRIPDWVVRNHGNLERVVSVLEGASDLVVSLDGSIQRCYRYGRPPSVIERWRVTRRVRNLRSRWDELRFDAKRRKHAEEFDLEDDPMESQQQNTV